MQTDLFRVTASAFRITMAAGLVLTASLSAAQDEEAGAQRAPASAGDVALPTSEQIMNNPVLRNALSRSTDGLVFRRAPNGAVSVDLQGRFQNVSVARIDADGEIRMGCVTSHDSLAEFLAAHPGASEDDYAVEKKGRGDDK